MELTWGLPVILYLFLAGVGAGAVAVSSSVLLRGGGGGFGGRYFTLARYGALIGPFPVMLGTMLIILELGRPDRALNLFKLVNLSPMSIGSWLLLVFIIVSLIYAGAYLPSFFPELSSLHDRLRPLRRGLAWFCVPFGIGVGVYTGVMIGAMPSRPFWNSPIIALLFLISALSTGVAVLILTQSLFYRKSATPEGVSSEQADRQYHQSSYLLTASDVVLIGFEMIVVFLFLMFAHLTVGDVKFAVDVILPGGELAATFWFWVILIGLLIPGVVELAYVVPKLVYHRDYHAPRAVEIVIPIFILTGGFMLRYVIVVAGQVTGPVGL